MDLTVSLSLMAHDILIGVIFISISLTPRDSYIFCSHLTLLGDCDVLDTCVWVIIVG